MNKGPMLVVAGALQRADDHWLVHRRPFEKHHGGLWEFPGDKVEPTEFPAKALCRELEEELGIIVQPDDCEPVAFAEESADGTSPGIVILLYKIAHWQGEPCSVEDGDVAWLLPDSISDLDRPPLDVILAQRLFST